MRVQLVAYNSTRCYFECIHDSRSRDLDHFVTISAYSFMRAAGFDSHWTDEQAESMLGKEFDVPGLIPYEWITRGKPTLLTEKKWTDRGEQRCASCGKYCTCGDNWQPEAAA